jgi:hypothetical protein
VDVVALITGLGLGGLALALAARETLENLFASFTIFLDLPFVVGDSIQVGTISGDIEKIGFRSTRLRGVDGNLIVNGTVSYIQTETLLIEDNIITLNATFSGNPFLNAGIEVIRGNEPVSSFIWNESTDLWSAGLSGSEVPIFLGAGTGLTSSGQTVSLNLTGIVGTGLTQNGSQISVINYSPFYQSSLSTLTSGNNSTTGITLSNTPSQYSRVQLFVNGQLQKIGDGTFSNVDCYFSNDGGLSALSFTSLVSGNVLYWNGVSAGFELDATDEIDIIYEY